MTPSEDGDSPGWALGIAATQPVGLREMFGPNDSEGCEGNNAKLEF